MNLTPSPPPKPTNSSHLLPSSHSPRSFEAGLRLEKPLLQRLMLQEVQDFCKERAGVTPAAQLTAGPLATQAQQPYAVTASPPLQAKQAGASAAVGAPAPPLQSASHSSTGSSPAPTATAAAMPRVGPPAAPATDLAQAAAQRHAAPAKPGEGDGDGEGDVEMACGGSCGGGQHVVVAGASEAGVRARSSSGPVGSGGGAGEGRHLVPSTGAPHPTIIGASALTVSGRRTVPASSLVAAAAGSAGNGPVVPAGLSSPDGGNTPPRMRAASASSVGDVLGGPVTLLEGPSHIPSMTAGASRGILAYSASTLSRMGLPPGGGIGASGSGRYGNSSGEALPDDHDVVMGGIGVGPSSRRDSTTTCGGGGSSRSSSHSATLSSSTASSCETGVSAASGASMGYPVAQAQQQYQQHAAGSSVVGHPPPHRGKQPTSSASSGGYTRSHAHASVPLPHYARSQPSRASSYVSSATSASAHSTSAAHVPHHSGHSYGDGAGEPRPTAAAYGSAHRDDMAAMHSSSAAVRAYLSAGTRMDPEGGPGGTVGYNPRAHSHAHATSGPAAIGQSATAMYLAAPPSSANISGAPIPSSSDVSPPMAVHGSSLQHRQHHHTRVGCCGSGLGVCSACAAGSSPPASHPMANPATSSTYGRARGTSNTGASAGSAGRFSGVATRSRTSRAATCEASGSGSGSASVGAGVVATSAGVPPSSSGFSSWFVGAPSGAVASTQSVDVDAPSVAGNGAFKNPLHREPAAHTQSTCGAGTSRGAPQSASSSSAASRRGDKQAPHTQQTGQRRAVADGQPQREGGGRAAGAGGGNGSAGSGSVGSSMWSGIARSFGLGGI